MEPQDGLKAEQPVASLEASLEATLKAPVLRVQNVVATFSLGCKNLNLRLIASRLRFLEYNPHKFAAATLRVVKGDGQRTTGLIFGSGNVVCTGAKNAADARFACRTIVNIFQKCNVKVSFHNFRIQNIVGSTGLTVPIKLQELHHQYSAYTSYESSLFPGLVFRLRNKICFLLFRSGRLVVTGGKTEEQLHKYWNAFYHLVLTKYMDLDNDLRCSSEYRIQNEKNKYSMSFFYDALK